MKIATSPSTLWRMKLPILADIDDLPMRTGGRGRPLVKMTDAT